MCTDADVDPGQLINDLTAEAAGLADCEDPLEAELLGATFLSICAQAGEGFEDALVTGLIPELQARPSSGALATLLAIESVTQGQVGKESRAAADRLAEAGFAPPAWAAELREPLTVADCVRLADPHGTASVLACSFHRAGRSHAFMVSVDHLDCGAASNIILLDADHLPEALAGIRGINLDHGSLMEEALDAADLRWHVESALDARAVHDEAYLSEEERAEALVEEDGPGYPVLAVLLRSRMNALPVPSRRPAAHANESERSPDLPALRTLLQGAGTGPFGGKAPAERRGRAVAALPPKRQKSDRPAPVYQIKATLRGTKPPIWRRLQVPADFTLERLHTVLQIAFGWEDYHLHVFETPYGGFGNTDADLGYGDGASVTLEQVAPTAKSRLRYTYDFGDGWEHEILVEKVLDRDDAVTYPRCTGGRRAGPPEDCGGIWGYAELLEILSDPADPEHNERLEWLGLDDGADFDPDAFDPQKVTQALSALA